ncbi:hypothetical protein M0R45_009547 [Rubus argutus]|uniref:Pentatricopeptide repeat-containing protein n=1 Tax=Rubus argutus TaxID=59490 RepID=A0AAW1Y655_RUBAR
MEEKGIDDNRKTWMLRLYSYAAISDIDRMEKILLKMEADPLVTINWCGYVAAAKAFMKAGQLEKAFTLLNQSEKLVGKNARRIAYECLLALYAAIGKKDEVYRIWNLYKNMGKFNNNGYRSMLKSLVKMDDIVGAEKIVEEWESEFKQFDIQLPNLLVNA